MGIIHYAVNYDKKLYYCLDKGNWYNLSIDSINRKVVNVDNVIVFGCRRKLKRICRRSFNGKVESWYIDNIARKLAKIVPFRIVDDYGGNDCYIDNPKNMFVCIGSRN